MRIANVSRYSSSAIQLKIAEPNLSKAVSIAFGQLAKCVGDLVAAFIAPEPA